MNPVGVLHEHMVFRRRARVLAQALARTIPPDAATVLDVGCGDGTIAALVRRYRPALSLTGVDVLVRPRTHIPVHAFDGVRLPFADGSFDVVMFVDVLHHTDDPSVLLREAKRVARRAVVLKDHTRDRLMAQATLRFMDWVGNAHHGVALPYNYWPEAKWRDAFARIGLSPQLWAAKLDLYPFPASLLFERNLHFLARLAV
jgi:ubiquinone/menaquinone biosynthesis C-methylase UbiE